MILDTGQERAYDEITRLLASSLEVPFTMVNMLDETRDWFKSCVGVQQTESPAVTSLCEAFFSTTRDLIVVDDTLLHPQLITHPKVVGRPFLRFYAAARLMVRGQTVGTLCAYDVVPRQLTAEQLEHLRTLASAAVELIGQRGRASDALPTAAR
jgi:GAF domain-containing protein